MHESVAKEDRWINLEILNRLLSLDSKLINPRQVANKAIGNLLSELSLSDNLFCGERQKKCLLAEVCLFSGELTITCV